MLYSTEFPSPIGKLILAGDGVNLCGLWLEGQKYFMQGINKTPGRAVDLPVFQAAKQWLDRYFAGKKPSPEELPLAPCGSGFRQLVWRCLLQIPYGQVTTYGNIAKEVSAAMGLEHMSAQAVGGAVGHNPISIIIPCHRVVGADGSLTGYAGGIEKKIQLLTLEGANFNKRA